MPRPAEPHSVPGQLTSLRLQSIAALVLWLVEPLAFALEVQSALPRLAAFGVPAFLVLAARAVVTIVGVAAGRQLWDGDVQGWALARWWALASAGGVGLTFLTPYFPSNRTPLEKRVWLCAWLAIYAAAFAAAHSRTRQRPSREHARASRRSS